MIRAFVFERTAVLVWPDQVANTPPEHGARVEVRFRDREQRGSGAAAQRVVIDMPVFRADLFDRLDQEPGNMGAAHFHPTFDGVEPCRRQWKDELKNDPIGWISAELSDLPALLGRSGLVDATEPWVEADAEEMRAAVPLVTAAIRENWIALGIAPRPGPVGVKARITTKASALRSRVRSR